MTAYSNATYVLTMKNSYVTYFWERIGDSELWNEYYNYFYLADLIYKQHDYQFYSQISTNDILSSRLEDNTIKIDKSVKQLYFLGDVVTPNNELLFKGSYFVNTANETCVEKTWKLLDSGLAELYKKQKTLAFASAAQWRKEVEGQRSILGLIGLSKYSVVKAQTVLGNIAAVPFQIFAQVAKKASEALGIDFTVVKVALGGIVVIIGGVVVYKIIPKKKKKD